jgi:hypothetical protein
VSVRDDRDLVIEALADSEAALVDRIVDLTCERDSYRLLAQQLLGALHVVTLERDVLRDQRVLDRRRDRDQQRAA